MEPYSKQDFTGKDYHPGILFKTNPVPAITTCLMESCPVLLLTITFPYEKGCRQSGISMSVLKSERQRAAQRGAADLLRKLVLVGARHRPEHDTTAGPLTSKRNVLGHQVFRGLEEG